MQSRPLGAGASSEDGFVSEVFSVSETGFISANGADSAVDPGAITLADDKVTAMTTNKKTCRQQQNFIFQI